MSSSRLWRAICVVLLALTTLSAQTASLLAQTDCSQCVAARYNFSNPSGEYTVCIQSSVPFEAQQSMAEGIQYWGDVFAAQGIGISFNVIFGTEQEECGQQGIDWDKTDDIEFYADNNMYTPIAIAESHLTTDMRGSGVGMNLDYLGSNPTHTLTAGQWAGLAAHELGHLLDYRDVNSSGCSGASTVMWYQNASLPTTPTCTDLAMIIWRWTSNQYDTNQSVPSQDHEDCYDVYQVTVTWYTTNNVITELYVSFMYLGYDCGGGLQIEGPATDRGSHALQAAI